MSGSYRYRFSQLIEISMDEQSKYVCYTHASWASNLARIDVQFISNMDMSFYCINQELCSTAGQRCPLFLSTNFDPRAMIPQFLPAKRSISSRNLLLGLPLRRWPSRVQRVTCLTHMSGDKQQTCPAHSHFS